MELVDELSRLATLRQAWEHVASKGGVPGIDRVSVTDFGRDLEANLGRLEQEITSLSYRSLPVLRIRPPFLATSDRALVILTVPIPPKPDSVSD